MPISAAVQHPRRAKILYQQP